MAPMCTLEKLFPSEEIQFIVYDRLNEYFQLKFTKVIKEASAVIPYLVEPAKFFEKDIKDAFIYKGVEMQTYEDLDIILKSFNYLKFKDFRKQKENFDRLGGDIFIRDKRVAFDQ